ncbi:hypothetical protein CATRI_00140 [Corynebacterium atrinae]|nr:hypothetical protein CATRI_00140 [Corynebacterium atrinae]
MVWDNGKVETNDHAEVTEQLRALEPIFHRAEVGSGREVFESMTAAGYWEVGASGRVYAREYVIETLVERYAHPYKDLWTIDKFEVRSLADGLFLVTYELDQEGRRSRRSTIWRWSSRGWIAEYHQGTLA